uniref:AlNc14C566G12160 protein n=1 Tax=Albugo laibachii Nc14 TaxID=890382 RepID=F0X167_9STRA|nr:AlNc14C566G12160 [Albugo laibachii Nc14]|eukprot:CCA27524.1 AlNc14C566G12160 [Albugo laibachii Nc14]
MMLELDDIGRWSVYSCEVKLLSIDRIPSLNLTSSLKHRIDSHTHSGQEQSISTCFDLMRYKFSGDENWLVLHAAMVSICQILDLLNASQVCIVVKHIFSMAYGPQQCILITAKNT